MIEGWIVAPFAAIYPKAIQASSTFKSMVLAMTYCTEFRASTGMVDVLMNSAKYLYWPTLIMPIIYAIED